MNNFFRKDEGEQVPGKVHWKGLIGGNRKWKSGVITKEIQAVEGVFQLQVERLGRLEDAFEIVFSWNAPLSFGEVLLAAGLIPLPPYMSMPFIKFIFAWREPPFPV